MLCFGSGGWRRCRYEAGAVPSGAGAGAGTGAGTGGAGAAGAGTGAGEGAGAGTGAGSGTGAGTGAGEEQGQQQQQLCAAPMEGGILRREKGPSPLCSRTRSQRCQMWSCSRACPGPGAAPSQRLQQERAGTGTRTGTGSKGRGAAAAKERSHIGGCPITPEAVLSPLCSLCNGTAEAVCMETAEPEREMHCPIILVSVKDPFLCIYRYIYFVHIYMYISLPFLYV